MEDGAAHRLTGRSTTMMGAHHAASGAAAWVVIASDYEVPIAAVSQPLRESSSSLSWLPDAVPIGAQLVDVGAHTHAAVIAGAVMMAGAALLPDIDHRSGTIAHALPPASKILARLTEKVSGGHRHGTHSILGIAALTLLASVIGLVSIETEALGTVHLGAGVLSVLLAAFAFKALRFIPRTARRAPWISAAAFGVFAALTFPPGAHWLALLVGLGSLVHVLGDFLTNEGVNWLWPLRIGPPERVAALPLSTTLWRDNGHVSLPVLGTVDSIRAHLTAGVLSAVAVAGLIIAVLGTVRQGLGAVAAGVLG